MPIYEYRCRECGEIQEVIVPPGGVEVDVRCTYCGAAGMEKLLSAHAGAHLSSRPKGRTCCGRQERCSTPPCSMGGTCRRDNVP